MEWIASPEAWIALGTLTVLEIVLGIDNIVFITILSGKLPAEKQPFARQLGLGLAMLTRILLLLSLVWIMRLTAPLFGVFGHAVSGRDLILIAGGMFLLMKATTEIHHRLEGDEGKSEDSDKARRGSSFRSVITQIVLLDIVFSLDSVITAVGVADHVPVMVIAIVIAVGVMMLSAGPVGEFVLRHPTVKMLALSFLLLIGMSLVAEGLGHHVPKGYIYFAMGFSLLVETFNLKARKTAKRAPVALRTRFHSTAPVEPGSADG